MEDRVGKVISRVEGLREEMVECLKGCIRRPALGPSNGGQGEKEKADYLEDMMRGWSFDGIERYEAPDGAVESGSRPNIHAWLKGSSGRDLWLIAHMDVVPTGDPGQWDHDPFDPLVKDGRLYGRGAEDNGQDLVASMFAARALMEAEVVPEHNVNILLAADEETGSVKGVKWLMRAHPDLFKKDALIVVPDATTPTGELVEVSEKSIMFLKVRTLGKMVHGSTPEKGVNAHRAGARFITEVYDALHTTFSKKDPMFRPPISTFEVTKKEPNIPNLNAIPGEDIVYFDNRVLPDYRLDDVLRVYSEVGQSIARESGATFEFLPLLMDEAAPPTSPTDDIAEMMLGSISAIYGNRPFCGGIGGGTYAAMFRRAGIPAVVWSKGDDKAHQPNEYCIIENLVGDSKVFAHLAMTRNRFSRPGTSR